VVNQLIRWTCEVNWPGAEPPVFEMWDQESRDVTQAARDKSNYDAGARFTNAYWVREYGYQDGDLKPEGTPSADPDGVTTRCRTGRRCRGGVCRGRWCWQ
jgi:hypothetical protein